MCPNSTKIIGLICLLCSSMVVLTAQDLNLRFEHFSLEDGISDLRISAVIQDRKGFLWIGTHEGLNRYDGYAFKVYRHDPLVPTSLTSGNIEDLLEDSQGRIWIGGDHLCRYDPKTDAFVHFKHNPADPTSVSPKYISSLAETPDGYLWIGTVGNELYRYDPKRGHFKHFSVNQPGIAEESQSSSIYLTYVDKSGGLWVGSGFPRNPNRGGLHRYHPESETFTTYRHDPADSASLRYNAVMAAFEDSRGNFWVGTGGDGLHLMDRDQGTFTHFPYDPLQLQRLSGPISNYRNSITAFAEDPYGRLWITGGGLVIYDQNTLEVHRIQPNEENAASPGSWFIWAMLLDRSGNAWLGDGFDAFLDKVPFKPSIFQEYREVPGNLRSLTGNRVFSLAKTSQTDALWVGTEKGLNLFDPAAGQVTRFIPVAGGVRVISAGSEDQLWYGSWETGIFRYEPKTDKTFPLPELYHETENPPDVYLSALCHTHNGTLWAGTWENGLFRFDQKANRFERYLLEGKGIHITALLEDRDGRLWIATSADGLLYFDTAKNRLIRHSNISGYALLEDRSGSIWLASTQDGLWLLEKDALPVRVLGTRNGLASNSIFALAEDPSGNLWLSTGKKVSKFNPADGSYRNYDIGEGLFNQFDIFAANAAISTTAGKIYFGGARGLTEVFPSRQLQSLDAPPQVVITRLQTLDTTFLLSYDSIQKLEFSYHQHTLSFDYIGLDYNNPAQHQYQYQLENYDPDWVSAGTGRRARYSQLHPGKYYFRVKAAGSEGNWSEPSPRLEVIIHPPWWQTGWAYLSYAILLTSLLLLARRQVIQRERLKNQLELEQLEREKVQEIDQLRARFYTNITHEFRTPLTVIKGMADQISGNEKIRQLIRRNSNRLLAMVNQLLDLSKLENNSLKIKWVQADIIPYLQYLTESCHSLAESKKLNLAFFSRENELLMDFDEEKLQQILINLLSNAVKFTPEYGSVKVIAAKTEEAGSQLLELQVKDTGRGIPPEKLPHIFDRFYQVDDSATRQGEGSGIGLALVKELVQLLEGRIEVESEVGKGSSFKVYLPIHQRAEQLAFNAEDRAEPILAAAPVSIAEESGLITDPNSEKPLVLIIEDNADVVEYIVSCLAPDYHLQTAPNGRLGVEKAFEIIPDVILCDVMMPEMDGFEVCRQLKVAAPTSHIPIVLLTAKATQEDKVTGLSQGADAYLTKPFDKAELLVRLENLSRLSQQLRERLATPATVEDLPDPVSAKEAAFLQELSQIVADNLSDEDFNTPRLCRAIAMSRTQLHRKLKALTGQSTAQYIRHCRMQKARSLLEQTDLPIGEIANQVGFKDFSHFSKSFLKVMGVSPSGLRDRSIS